MDTANWMRDLWSNLSAREIWDVLLPGTHASGCFSALNTIGVRTQDKTIGEQLNGGIRCFDIRVTKRGGVYLMHHDGNYPAGESQALLPALEEMASFAKEHDHEIFIVRLETGYGSNIGESEYEALREKVLEKLASYLVSWNANSSFTLSSIQSTGRSIILISKIGAQKGKENLFWSAGSSIFVDTWEEFQSECKPTPTEKLEWLKPHVEKALKSPPERFLYASCMIWTVNLLDAAKEWTNPALSSWLGQWSVNPDLRAGMNIFVVDFFDVWDSQVVSTIVALNRTQGARRSSQTKGNPPPLVSNPEPRHMPYFRDAGSFDVPAARRLLAALHLDPSVFEHELEQTGSLGEQAIAELETAGIPKTVTIEFLKWYAQHGVDTV